jgi:hypothetical protein
MTYYAWGNRGITKHLIVKSDSKRLLVRIKYRWEVKGKAVPVTGPWRPIGL